MKMFTALPPHDDDVRLLADALWRYSHSERCKYRVSVEFVDLNRIIAKSTTCIERQYSGRFHRSLNEPREDFLAAALKKFEYQPFRVKIVEESSAGASLIKIGDRQFRQAPQEQFLFSSPFLSDFVVKIDKVSECEDEVTGTETIRQGVIFELEKPFCKLEVSGGTNQINAEAANGFVMIERFAEVVVKCKDFAAFQERECLQTARDVLGLVKFLIGELS